MSAAKTIDVEVVPKLGGFVVLPLREYEQIVGDNLFLRQALAKATREKANAETVTPCHGLAGDQLVSRCNRLGNIARLRDALEEQLRYWNRCIRTHDEEEMRKRTEAALVEPARNCDIYATWDDAFHAWDHRHDNFGRWLFAAAENRRTETPVLYGDGGKGEA